MGGNRENDNQNVTSKPIPVKDWWFFVIAIIAFVVVLLSYFINFGFSGHFSDKNEVWGQFADFVGGLMNPLLSIIVLWTLIKTLRFNSEAIKHSADAVKEAEKSRLSEESRVKRQNAFDFSQTFQSDSMIESRLIASKLLKQNQGKSYSLKTMKHLDDYVHLAKVLNSFRQLNVLKNRNLIDVEISKELFGSYYVHFKEYFERIRKDNDEGFKGLLGQIEELKDWIPTDYYD